MMMGVAMGHDSNLARLQAPVTVPIVVAANGDSANSSGGGGNSDGGSGRTSGFEVVVGAMQLHPDNRYVPLSLSLI